MLRIRLNIKGDINPIVHVCEEINLQDGYLNLYVNHYKIFRYNLLELSFFYIIDIPKLHGRY